MAYDCDRPEFTVTVNSESIGNWRWMVHAAVRYHGRRSDSNRKRIEAEARLELMIGISQESGRGRASGARTVVVLVDGDSELSWFFRGLDDRLPPLLTA
jgi:hypothetical protein